jgi:hypothetical protein
MLFNWNGELDYTIDCGALVSTLDVGDNFAMNAKADNLEGHDFWIILCTRPLHQAKRAFKNKWGTSFELGDEVVVDLYYQKWGT